MPNFLVGVNNLIDRHPGFFAVSVTSVVFSFFIGASLRLPENDLSAAATLGVECAAVAAAFFTLVASGRSCCKRRVVAPAVAARTVDSPYLVASRSGAASQAASTQPVVLAAV